MDDVKQHTKARAHRKKMYNTHASELTQSERKTTAALSQQKDSEGLMSGDLGLKLCARRLAALF